jgi:Rhodopirellula transposase.
VLGDIFCELPKNKLAPFGILNMTTGLLTIIFGVSFETSDFIVDCLDQWWEDNKAQNPPYQATGHQSGQRPTKLKP